MGHKHHSKTSKRRSILLEELEDKILRLKDKNEEFQDVINHLCNKLSRTRNKLTTAEQDNSRLKKLLSQNERYRVSAIIDGDGAIFSEELIQKGREGGLEAARLLFDALKRYLDTEFGNHPYQIWVYIFYNKRGLADVLGKANIIDMKDNLEDFVMGFNQAANTFIMVDVGWCKEAADAKVRSHLDEDIVLPQTFKVFFSGSHDNGYVTALRPHLTAGLQEKLILLHSYDEIASGISELRLPSLTVPGLFMPQKLVISNATVRSRSDFRTAKSHATADRSQPKECLSPPSPTASPKLSRVSKKLPMPITNPKVVKLPKQNNADATAAAPTSQGGASKNQNNDVLRQINPNLPLARLNPAPCNWFYLTPSGKCRYGVNCTFSHDYELSAGHIEELKLNAKKLPCLSMRSGEVCSFDDKCIYGHKCPMASKCRYYKQGRCKFVGDDMHESED